jgi:hypothetical protein
VNLLLAFIQWFYSTYSIFLLRRIECIEDS